MNPIVHRTLVVQLRAEGTARCPVLAHLSYDPEDPFAVTVMFTLDGRVLARWRLDREMLNEGLREPVGHGDVRLRPVRQGRWREVRMDFLGDPLPGGERHHAVVFAWAPALASFLGDTYMAVPPGTEQVRMDDVLAEILATG
ncbi:SsgA family sporulation/cell division regulator [Streptomyces sp. NPDC001068]|uniref:SsgA family sporulation/cell division regulator n=1 Tax=Streptomyces sp. NPDC001068 TaxID=3364544 RepID=UPI0036CFB383